MTDYRSRLIFGAIAVQQVGDVLSTRWCERNPLAYEANPIAAPYVHLPLATLLAIKLTLPALGYLLWRWAEGRYERREGRPVSSLLYLPFLVVIGIYSYVIVSNLAIALQGGPLW